MPKKDFKHNTTAIDKFFPDDEPEQQTHGTHKTLGTHRTHPYYRVNLKLNPGFKEYLANVSWERRQSITQYINCLIEADKAKREVSPP